MTPKRLLSGIQTSGTPHIGNYFGMMQRMVDFQETSELFCFLANYHALTSVSDGDQLRKNTLTTACDFLALGIDPEKSVFWVQSDLPEVTELTWLLSNVTGMGLLERSHSYKDKVSKGITATHGLFSYPVLMSADILMFGSQVVPVGKDQKQHVEMTRDIAQRFNSTYGNTFVVPEPLIETATGLLPGIDGQKMSKSYNNTIDIFCDKATLAKKVMCIVTDSTPVDQPKDTENSTLFAIYSLFLEADQQKELVTRFQTPGTSYGALKKDLVEVIWNYFAPQRELRNELANNTDHVIKILKQGADKARSVAMPYLERARNAVGLNYTR
ncbi:tryptophan--tRNA ligase [bacterium]|jgi:tryptophanyl-tRNA synthetase|nr:tryptophan--tRNA ligase [bacterium]MBT3903388.1 tryptophan--tRNA ligase [bacterium]MBT4578194.1 tryptophan--tRNA ligase [bacterium]MBT5345855.1 tryptophan--tRNA ligase [bacterium]MBT6130834.1 tryptophan--tRNA ligase [bacterium]